MCALGERVDDTAVSFFNSAFACRLVLNDRDSVCAVSGVGCQRVPVLKPNWNEICGNGAKKTEGSANRKVLCVLQMRPLLLHHHHGERRLHKIDGSVQSQVFRVDPSCELSGNYNPVEGS